MTWTAAQRYCLDQKKRLPTEAEWEFAARGVGRRTFPWGEAEPRCGEVAFGRARGAGCTDGNSASDVGTAGRDVTPEGVFDLGGNAAEWVADAYAAPYASCSPDCKNPLTPGLDEPSVLRVIRGGDWAQTADASRAAGRS